MNPVDSYLECLYEGEKWNKVKSFAKKHKGKLITGAALAAGAYAAKSDYDRSHTPEKIAARNAQKAIDDKAAAADLARRRSNKAKSIERNSKIKAALYATGKTAEIVTRPVRYVAGKTVSTVGKGVVAGGKAVGKGISKSVSDTAKNIRDGV